jgi:hypothetical protein
VLEFSTITALCGRCYRILQVRLLQSTLVILNLREFLPDDAIPPIEMGDGAAPVVPEFKHLGSVLSKSFDDSVTIMARIRSARIAFTKLQRLFSFISFIYAESKKAAYVSRCRSYFRFFCMARNISWVVNAENLSHSAPTGSAFGLCAESLAATLGNIALRPVFEAK